MLTTYAPHVLLGLGCLLGTVGSSSAAPTPHVLFVLTDDLGIELGCYDFTVVQTPHIDRFAAEGVRYTHAFTTAPACSPSRSALFTGHYQTTLGAHHHRTANPRPLAPGVRTVAEQFRAAGYYTVNVNPSAEVDVGQGITHAGSLGTGKTDFNFLIENAFDGPSWAGRAAAQPFFAQITLFAPHRGFPWEEAARQPDRIDPASVPLPSFYPDHPVIREDFAHYLDAVQIADRDFGELRARLEREGLWENTIVVFTSDNGRCLPRGKQFLYDGGLHVPLIIRWPDGRRAGEVDSTLVSGVDIPSMLLGLAGLTPDPGMHGRDFLNPDIHPRDHIIAARDRMGLASDRQRAVRDHRYKYIRNYQPSVPLTQINLYKENEYPPWNVIKDLGRRGLLSPEQALFTAPEKPFEELYDVIADPDEVRNLVADPLHADALALMRARLDAWLAIHPDEGAVMEEPADILRINRGYMRHVGHTQH
jgi:N-sulfoglucosamine sulfohydrolase